jgi:hypothetical protein
MKTKKWYQSATFWVNAIDIAVILADKFFQLNVLSLEAHGIILAVLNIALRLFKTDSAVTL